ncbi:hypothetical protein ACFLU6_00485 [Acidobacteriota bacterium]
MQKKHILLLLVIVALAAGIFLRHYFSAEQVVKRKLLRAEDGFEKEQFIAAILPIDRNYRDPYGLDRESLAGYIKAAMDNYDNLNAEISFLGLTKTENEVRMPVRFWISASQGGSSGYVLGSRDEPCTAVFVWRKGTQGYKITTTDELNVPGHRDEIRRRISGTMK